MPGQHSPAITGEAMIMNNMRSESRSNSGSGTVTLIVEH